MRVKVQCRLNYNSFYATGLSKNIRKPQIFRGYRKRPMTLKGLKEINFNDDKPWDRFAFLDHHKIVSSASTRPFSRHSDVELNKQTQLRT